ncbi:glycerophosphodiester phosphodiesterase [Corynebacterium minutissimum]|uniref:Glycerophosphodiester phosphodiesterase n=1 Tax=Corynebacterium minutissimum TaxID=38301 RepID=A0A2X4UAX1_9CORY|nr:glycerophosphodiester phosphodiesterase [Corynebacterium minutissimum]KHO28947.1 hypothetical protein NX84_08225 [Corynebacterium minutissimum]QPS59086.1 glycerophosphodiester phosphodiesterase [Corynebacterium minutissimum]QQA80124.1 glycerophosphodiester phosphodiesterase [Corynebacterium minutissimum]SQH99745.1 Glycerophosphoryl diester phosphodiesterase [Corynebacterium minutissimum]VEG06188.1 Glycerophosphoryl diester phosphodiesterase [Corynebacterium minutissimum]
MANQKKKLSLIGLSFAVIAATVGPVAYAQEKTGETKPVAAVAHRGDKQYFPDNSIAGIESAIKKNTDWIEIDLRYNLDGGTFFIAHDNTCSGSGGTAIIDTASYESVVTKCGLPELSDVFDIIAETGYTNFVYEFKDSPLTARTGAQRLAEEISEQGLADKSWVSAFNETSLNVIRAEAPSISLMRVRAWTGEVPVTNAWIDATVSQGFDAININIDALRPESIEYAKSKGLVVSAWGWPDALEDDNQKAIELGVDMFMTDRLEDLVALTH